MTPKQSTMKNIYAKGNNFAAGRIGNFGIIAYAYNGAVRPWKYVGETKNPATFNAALAQAALKLGYIKDKRFLKGWKRITP